MNKRKLLRKLLASPANARFGEFCSLVEAFGFVLVRVSGSHHIFAHPLIADLLNLQEVNGEAKPYQVRQFLQLIEEFNLILDDQP